MLDTNYINALQTILVKGTKKSDRTGTGTVSLFGLEIRHDLSKGFPLITTKKVHFKSVVHELIWMLSGSTSINYLTDNGVRIWKEWSDEHGEVGKLYPYQWRRSGGNDQIKNLIEGLKNDPDSRRHVVSAWNVSELNEMALHPCHYSFQCYVDNGKLSLMFNMRSSDTFLGLPFNIASYALLTHMLAQVCDLEVGELIWRGGDCHIYLNHIDQVNKQIARHTRGEVFELPTIKLNKDITDIDDFTYEDIEIINYQSGSTIKGDVAI